MRISDIAAADDVIHADEILGINNGEIKISKCYEGIESKSLIINDGTIHIVSSDDGINAADGTDLLTFKSAKKYQSVAFTSPELNSGATYNVYLGGTSTGTSVDGLYTDGEYTAGTKYTSFTISGIVTKVTR